MATYTGLFTIGKDAMVRQTQGGDAVASLSMVTNYGRKGSDGKKPSQWIDGVLWGKQAEALAQYLTKGKQVYASIEDLHIEEYESGGEKRSKLTGRIQAIEFARDGGQSQGGQTQQAPQRQQAAPKRQSCGFDDGFDSDIPF